MARVLIHQAMRKDFRVDWFSGTGGGGQHRNKHQNCCRITHLPTGIVTTGQAQRDRPSNLRFAFRKMADLLTKHWLGEDRRERWPVTTETIRTYHEPDNRVVDHASGLMARYADVVGKRDIGEMIEARRSTLLEGEALKRLAAGQ